MCLDMFRKMITPHKPFATMRTLEPLLASMCPSMALEFIGSGEAFTAE
jgi:hypothetical protein